MMMKPVDIRRAEALAARQRIEELRGTAQPPEACGFDAPAAPARGRAVELRTDTVRDDGKGGTVYETTGYRGRSAFRAEDALDRIRGLSEAQREAGRRYAALAELVAAGGMKCSGSFMQLGMGGVEAARDFMDLHADRSARLRRMERAIGDGIGMALRRVRPSDLGTKTSISDRRLVDMVCIGQLSLSEVLRAHGWSEAKKTRDLLTAALAAILERLR